jgi:hypothetical protein
MPGMDTLPLVGLPRRLFSVSASSLGAWLDCPRRYRMTYVDRPAPPRAGAFAHSSLGTSVHNALREWWLAPRGRRTPEAAATFADLAWVPDGYRDVAQAETWRVRARRCTATPSSAGGWTGWTSGTASWSSWTTRPAGAG